LSLKFGDTGRCAGFKHNLSPHIRRKTVSKLKKASSRCFGERGLILKTEGFTDSSFLPTGIQRVKM
jgi:hypothetical protein